MAFVVAFPKVTEPKGTWQFVETGPRDEHTIGTLYVKKATLKAMGWPTGVGGAALCSTGWSVVSDNHIPSTTSPYEPL